MSLPRTSPAAARVFLTFCILLALQAARASAQQAASALPAEKVRQIEALVSAEMARQKIPGLSVAVVAVQSGKLLRPETLEQMFTRQRTNDGKETGYGLGWAVNVRDGRRVVGHSGAQQRVSTFLHMQPDRGLAVVLMANIEDVRLGDLALQIGDILLK